jgi:hypothetical protein
MPKQDLAGWRARLPATVASVTAATIERAARLIDKASQAVPLHRTKRTGPDAPQPPEGGTAPTSRDDTH